jgi:hypothetical protein
MEEQSADSLQKLQYTKSIMPMNPVLDEIIKKKSLEFSDLTASEISEVIKWEKQQTQNAGIPGQPMLGAGMPGQPTMGGQPGMTAPAFAPTPVPAGQLAVA